MYKDLRIEMYRASITILALSAELGISEKTLRNKINGTTEFTWPEVVKIRKIVAPGMSLDDLFKKDSDAA